MATRRSVNRLRLYEERDQESAETMSSSNDPIQSLEGFQGGLSADNYITITKTSRATATRDLQDHVEMGALQRTGERKRARYTLNIPAMSGSP